MQANSERVRDPRRTGARAVAMLAAAGVAIGLVACGGESDDGAATNAAVGDRSACVAEVTKKVADYKKPMPLVVPEKPVDMGRNAGKTLWFISPTQATGYAMRVSKAFVVAAEAAGMKARIFDGKAQPDRFSQGIDQAVASGAAGIVIYAINPAIVPTSLQQAKRKGIPVIAAATGVPNPTDGTVLETISVDLAAEGIQMAHYAAMARECELETAVTFDPNQKALTTQRDAIKTEYERLCPETCTVKEHSMSLGTMATQLGSSIQSLLQRSPRMNAVIATFDSAALYMVPAIEQTGRDVPIIIATNGLPENLDLVRQGTAQIADVSYPPAEYTGWLIADQLGRGVLGEPVEHDELPMQLFDKQNVPPSNDFDVLWPELVDYQDAFKTVWGR